MDGNCFFKSIQLNGFLSFAPDLPSFEMKPLNVIIGPNGSGKSNFIEAFELLHATPVDFASAIRDGGGPGEWIWKGVGGDKVAQIDAVIGLAPTERPLRYKLAFTSSAQRVEVIDEAIEEPSTNHPDKSDVFFYYRFKEGKPVINVRENREMGGKLEPEEGQFAARPIKTVLSQRKDPRSLPGTDLGGPFVRRNSDIQRMELRALWKTRRPQQADDPSDQLRPDARNLALVLNEIQHRKATEVDLLINRFLPRFHRLTTRISGGTVQFYLHEEGLGEPIPATRLSDGTIRFLAILAALLAPTPPLLCIEEPEMGLHPDAMALLAEMLVMASQRMQLVVTTHSDVLISALSDYVDSVVVCENAGHGTTLHRLETEKLSFWLDKYRLGEIWRIGEIGGNL